MQKGCNRLERLNWIDMCDSSRMRKYEKVNKNNYIVLCRTLQIANITESLNSKCLTF